MSRSAHRGASFVGRGAEVIAVAQDRRLPVSEPPLPPIDDPSTLAGALELKRRIVAYWAAKGSEVECTIERGWLGTFVVRSKLRGGLPPARLLDDGADDA